MSLIITTQLKTEGSELNWAMHSLVDCTRKSDMLGVFYVTCITPNVPAIIMPCVMPKYR